MNAAKQRGRWRRRAWRAVGVSLAVYVLWLTASRWNGVPVDLEIADAAAGPSRLPIDPDRDRTKDLLAALDAIPPAPVWTLPPPPPGMQWSDTPSGPIDVSETLAGPWTPDTRPHLRAVIGHLRSAAVSNAIGRFAALRPGGCRVSDWGVPSRIRDASRLLVVHARLRHAEEGNVDMAIDDILTAYRLVGICYDSGQILLILTAQACEDLAQAEVRRLAHERGLNSVQTQRLNNGTRQTLPSSEAIWRYSASADEDQLRRYVDAAYSIDADGDGWLVLSRIQSPLGVPRRPAGPRLGAWNVLSVFFNDRRTVVGKIEQNRRSFLAAYGLPYVEGHARMTTLEKNQRLNLLDGPLYAASLTRVATLRYGGLVVAVARRRATLVAVALGAYRHDHGSYPISLDELVGRYLEAVPVDPFDGLPIRYRALPDADDYLLYCVGRDGVDDGGVSRYSVATADGPEGGFDRVFRHKRRENLYSEVTLEPAEP